MKLFAVFTLRMCCSAALRTYPQTYLQIISCKWTVADSLLTKNEKWFFEVWLKKGVHSFEFCNLKSIILTDTKSMRYSTQRHFKTKYSPKFNKFVALFWWNEDFSEKAWQVVNDFHNIDNFITKSLQMSILCTVSR